jgi:N-acetyl-alpha-D-muramate 1-phosphate uridylyltransferase
MQAIILAGGLGTRLRPITESIPKALVPVCGRPFLEYQLGFLKRNGVDEVILCVGYLGDLVEEHFGDGRRFGLTIRYGFERDRLLGTAGAVKNVEGLLARTFFVVNGDTYPPIDFVRVMESFLARDRLGLMVVFRNEDRWDRSNVVVDGDVVSAYDKSHKLPEMAYIDFGVSVFRREAFARLPAGVSIDLSTVYHHLITHKQLLAYETSQRFYEVGSPPGLREFETLVEARTLPTDAVD